MRAIQPRSSLAKSFSLEPRPSKAVDEGQASVAQAVERVQAEVFAVILEFNQVRLRGTDGRQFAITRRTQGVTLDDLREGQTVELVVTRELPRVISAQVVA